MSPTLTDIAGFASQVLAIAQSGTGFIGTYDTINNSASISYDTSVKRTARHVASLKIIEDGIAATNVQRNIAAGNRLVVGSFTFLVSSAPAATSEAFSFVGPTNRPQFNVLTNGKLQAKIVGGTAQTTAGSLADGSWHRLDYRVDTSTATYTIDWAVDGIAQTQASRGSQTAADMTAWRLGSASASDNLTAWFGDFVLSVTTGDYPIGPHAVLPIYPLGEGTETLGTTNPIVDEAGANSNLYQHIDDWNGGTPDSSTYITYTSTTLGDAASNFAEFTLGGINSYSAVWDVIGYLAAFASGTGADTADTKVLTAHGGTLIDHIGNLIDYSTNVLSYHRQLLARPSGGWTAANLSSSVIQWGFSTDTNANPRLSAVMLEFVVPEPAQLVKTTT